MAGKKKKFGRKKSGVKVRVFGQEEKKFEVSEGAKKAQKKVLSSADKAKVKRKLDADAVRKQLKKKKKLK